MDECILTYCEIFVVHQALLVYSDDLKRILKHSLKSSCFYHDVSNEISVVNGLIKKFEV